MLNGPFLTYHFVLPDVDISKCWKPSYSLSFTDILLSCTLNQGEMRMEEIFTIFFRSYRIVSGKLPQLEYRGASVFVFIEGIRWISSS